MFEPVHGSAPDIANRGIANPIATVLSGAMMLEHLGSFESARMIRAAVEHVLGSFGPRTPDLGGADHTSDMTRALVAALDR